MSSYKCYKFWESTCRSELSFIWRRCEEASGGRERLENNSKREACARLTECAVFSHSLWRGEGCESYTFWTNAAAHAKAAVRVWSMNHSLMRKDIHASTGDHTCKHIQYVHASVWFLIFPKGQKSQLHPDSHTLADKGSHTQTSNTKYLKWKPLTKLKLTFENIHFHRFIFIHKPTWSFTVSIFRTRSQTTNFLLGLFKTKSTESFHICRVLVT